MKKIFAAFAIAFFVFTVQADVAWSWWCDNSTKSVDLSLGIGAQCSSVDGLELSLLYGASSKVDGVQWSFLGINNSPKMSGALQMSPWFNCGGDPCVQLGLVNYADSAVFTWGLINVADKATVQLGLLNFNKCGFFPLFPFVNLDKELFD